MKWIPFIDMVFPAESLASLYLLLLTLAGVLMIVGMRKTSLALIGMTVMSMILPVFDPMFDSAFELLPDWAFWLLVIVFGLGILRWAAEVFIGKDATNQAVGNLLSDAFKGLLALPFRAIGWLFRAGPLGRGLLLALLGVGAFLALRWSLHLMP